MAIYDLALAVNALDVSKDILGVLQVCLILALAPLMTGIMRKVKARTQRRTGSSVIQPYYELLKLMKKEEVVSDQSSWIFRYAPYVMLVSTITAALFIPVFLPFSPFSSVGDILVMLGLFALANFFMMEFSFRQMCYYNQPICTKNLRSTPPTLKVTYPFTVGITSF